MRPPKSIASMAKPSPGVHAVRRNEHGNVLVSHPPLPGKDMIPPSPDYAELPAGSMSPHAPAGGITGGLGPRQSEAGAEMGEYSPQ